MLLPTKAIGLPSCSGTAPKLRPHAAQTSKGLFRSGKANADALHRAFFSPAKALPHSSDQAKLLDCLGCACRAASQLNDLVVSVVNQFQGRTVVVNLLLLDCN